ncbi:unnamed protein product [Mytilus edulis]|uniref:FAD-binding PCMH-type domain-containing protein n=1 Tax=Mytilus edulis TaxID=6550 RepID=A0A8S3T8H1_MYTED|nr:unnamed protein product [Mytilus edulis]
MNALKLLLLLLFVVLSSGNKIKENDHTRNHRAAGDNVAEMDEIARSDAVYARMRSQLRLLDYFIGPKGPRVDIRQFVNWDKTIIIDHLFYVKPKTIWEVQRVVNAAALTGIHIRATGGGHTRSPLYPDEGQISMDVRELERHDGPRIELHKPNSERPYQTVTVITGVLEYELNEFLVKNGLSMLSQPLIVNATVGGMVASSTHGSSWSAPTWSGYVVEMRLVNARGRLRRFSKEKHPELMEALMCNLGMMGVMYDITIQVNGTLIAKVQNQYVPLEDLFYNQTNLKNVVTSHFLTEISWYPFNSVNPEEEAVFRHNKTVLNSWTVRRDLVWLRTIVLVDAVPDDHVIQGPVYLPTGGSISGGNETGILRGKGALNIAKLLPSVSYHYLVDAFPTILPPKHGSETSAAFVLNIDNSFSRPLRAFKFMAEKVENQIKSLGSSPMNAFLPRFLQNMDCLLCFGNNGIKQDDDSGRSMVIDFLAPPTQFGFYDTAADFVQQFRQEKIRPHWAKRHTDIPGIVDVIKETYGDNLEKFNQLKFDSGIDKCGLFMNSYLTEIFGRPQSYYKWC